MTFQELVDKAPMIIKDKLNDLKLFRENPKYHPEGNTYEHIKIVTQRCIRLFPNDPNMFMTGILHDISKYDCRGVNKKTGQPTAYDHDKRAAELIDTNEDVQKYIKSFGADVDMVRMLVVDHMRMHTFTEMRSKKQMEMMEKPTFVLQSIFAVFDNMLLDDEVAIEIGKSIFIQAKLNEFKKLK